MKRKQTEVEQLRDRLDDMESQRDHALHHVEYLKREKDLFVATATDNLRQTRKLLRVIDVLLQPDTARGKPLSTDAQPGVKRYGEA